ncbi:MAG TPA: proline--tRNA ligase [Thermoclostridium caenicola]|uniref:Proline--tRNA ligase n=1 Tax=Thermoclostridium caenicola TaxID=659425 RepID=A0A1M6JS82_9FIRM|nr:proline--tRNA ligase [Thermoclostridium caenicola]SHJ49597.1 prolyl-tRNA synthetase [Thermoclostridium caenicola]HOK44134.1 proline--tRNA ligase [Thermoclostridium caenicola]HOL85509.1 proline--tRNA ligase [Thermoclostridium caenicola]HOP72676.1 proline--tRNA ligase [Thermoclostridium caenicola]HPO77988.1 proline--tRNA ligase [Thermoclostridium caenicola]
MRLSRLFFQTMRETPSDAEVVSHQLMMRAGLIRKQAAGIYAYMPLGYRVLRKIENIIREEMDAAGAQELLMPALLPAECYRESGRWDVFGEEMFRLRDRNQRDFCLGPTHEEAFTAAVRDCARSYRDLPLILYQIQTKYRDEIRPRFGVMRSREFLMKDAYSFDRDENGLDASYQAMSQAYRRIFKRLGLDCIIIDADTGAMGGSGSQEFMVRSEVGESEIIQCPSCGYAASIEKVSCVAPSGTEAADPLMPEAVATPDARTIREVTAFLGCRETDLAKTILYKADGTLVAAMVRGDREINETKLMAYLGAGSLEMADEESVRSVTGAEIGFAGPVGLPVRIVADLELEHKASLIVGANRTGYHLRHVVPHRDFEADFADIRMIAGDDPCPCCGAELAFGRGIEVGHIFKLGTKYSEALGCSYLDETGKAHPMVMGCYGIGVSRAMAAIIEQHHDENGILWPMSVAPWQVIIVPVNVLDEKQAQTAEYLYQELKKHHVEVLLDDRNERAGVKFKDADLIGIPIRINVGKKALEGLVEFKLRHEDSASALPVESAVGAVLEWIGKPGTGHCLE